MTYPASPFISSLSIILFCSFEDSHSESVKVYEPRTDELLLKLVTGIYENREASSRELAAIFSTARWTEPMWLTCILFIFYFFDFTTLVAPAANL